MTKTAQISGAAIEAMIHSPSSPVVQACEALAQSFADDARATLGIQRIGRYPNPAPGPPRRRTGDLQRSIKVAPPEFDPGLVVYVIADASIANHPKGRGGPYYPKWLLDNGYKFLSFELPETFH